MRFQLDAGVFARPRWNIIDLDKLESDDGDEAFRGIVPKAGESYETGTGQWQCLGYHDSGWRTAIDRFLEDHDAELLSIDDLASDRWFQVKELDEAEIEELAIAAATARR